MWFETPLRFLHLIEKMITLNSMNLHFHENLTQSMGLSWALKAHPARILCANRCASSVQTVFSNRKKVSCSHANIPTYVLKVTVDAILSDSFWRRGPQTCLNSTTNLPQGEKKKTQTFKQKKRVLQIVLQKQIMVITCYNPSYNKSGFSWFTVKILPFFG
jgi:hypothetical protein